MQINAFFDKFDAVIQEHRKFVVVCHVNPDGDAIGSVLAMTSFLKRRGHDVVPIAPNSFPSFLAWMPGAQDILVFENDVEASRNAIQSADYIMMLDFNSLSRCGLLHNEIGKTRCPRILVDHHRDPEMSQFCCALSETEVSSASELVAEIIFHYEKETVNQDVATNLLVGIMTDTGAFAHSIYHPRTFEICSQLVKTSASYNMIHQLVYDTFSESRLRLLGYSINKMEILDEYATAIISLSKSELESFNYQVGDTEGIVNYPLSLEKIRMSVLVTERQDQIRLSFRSKGDFSVHELANKHFKGGGHTNAAGGTTSDTLEETLQKLKSVLPEYKELLKK